MIKLATRLRIGEKIGLGFGLVALIFLAVIGYYDIGLRRAVDDYRDLYGVYGARQTQAFAIESHLTAMLAAAERFLRTRDAQLADEVHAEAEALQAEAERLAGVDAASAQTAREIRSLAENVMSRFDAIVEAWRLRGLDEDSGLQGAFRKAAHELEARAGHFDVDRPYLLLLQVRRSEKDLGLRRDAQYLERTHRLLEELSAAVSASDLRAPDQAALTTDIAAYRAALDRYAEGVLAGAPIDGGTGPFRDIAHRIEARLQAHYISGLQTLILQLRRREKDYLLRGDAEYIRMVGDIAEDIRSQIAASDVSAEEQQTLQDLLASYRRDFAALVAQDERIAVLTREMQEAAARITPIAEANLRDATALLEAKSAEIAATSAERARLRLLIAAAAALLGALLALLITVRIVRPVRAMAGLLQRMTAENPRERIPTDPAGRDEINAMAIALNTMADHKAKLFDWWRSSMRETIGLRDFQRAETPDERADAAAEVQGAAAAKLRQLEALRADMLREADRVDASADRLGGRAHRALASELRSVAAAIRRLLDVVGEPPQAPAA